MNIGDLRNEECLNCGSSLIIKDYYTKFCSRKCSNRYNNPPRNQERGRELLKLKESGLSLEAIGKRYNISGERVRQLIQKVKPL